MSREREIRRMCEDAGLVVVEITRNKHVKARVRTTDGRESVQVFPHTPGRGRATENRTSELRRFALARC